MRALCFTILLLVLSFSTGFPQKNIPGAGGLDTLDSKLKDLTPAGQVEYISNLAIHNKIINRNFLKYLDNSVQLAQTLGDKHLLAKALEAAGQGYYNMYYYNKAIVYFKSAALLYSQLQDTNSFIRMHHRIASSYFYQGDYGLSIISNIEALNAAQQIHDTLYIIINTRELGYKYLYLHKPDSAYKYLHRSYELIQNYPDIKNKALTLSEYGNYFLYTGQSKKALSLLHQALPYARQLSLKFPITITYTRLAQAYYDLGQLDSALYYAKLASRFRDARFLSLATKLTGQIYLKQHKYNLAKSYLDSATIWFSMTGNLKELADVYELLFNLYYDRQMTDSAICNLMMRSQVMDSLVKRYYDLQFSNIIIHNELDNFKKKLDSINKKEMHSRRRLLVLKIALIIFFSLLVIGLLFFLQQRKYLHKLELKNKTISQQNTEILAQTAKLEKQKQVLESINNQIKESLRCALMIQQATLPKNKDFSRFFDDFYMMYRPLQIVSGDFYWLNYLDKENSLFLALADGTGHGVPGAFISLITIRFLDEIILMNDITEPAEALNNLNKEFGNLIEKSGESLIILGVELVLLRIKKLADEYEVVFSCAKSAFSYYVPGQELVHVHSGNPAIGGVFIAEEKATFNQKKLFLPSGTVLYLYTDGYKDQICSGNKKRIATKRFHALLDEIKNLPVREQGKRIENFFDKCKGAEWQRDDVTVMILKFK